MDCDLILPFGQAKDVRAEMLAFEHTLGAHTHEFGGFPSTPFHDGYHDYNERIEAWMTSRETPERIASWLDGYAAGAFAKHLERKWKRGQR